jgi:hypothetical protein
MHWPHWPLPPLPASQLNGISSSSVESSLGDVVASAAGAVVRNVVKNEFMVAVARVVSEVVMRERLKELSLGRRARGR